MKQGVERPLGCLRSHLKHEELVSIANLAAKRLGIGCDRDAGSQKIVMAKWFEENWGASGRYFRTSSSSMNRSTLLKNQTFDSQVRTLQLTISNARGQSHNRGLARILQPKRWQMEITKQNHTE
jgi:hypothetical protein